jgi:hypothetical protein
MVILYLYLTQLTHISWRKNRSWKSVSCVWGLLHPGWAAFKNPLHKFILELIYGVPAKTKRMVAKAGERASRKGVKRHVVPRKGREHIQHSSPQNMSRKRCKHDSGQNIKHVRDSMAKVARKIANTNLYRFTMIYIIFSNTAQVWYKVIIYDVSQAAAIHGHLIDYLKVPSLRSDWRGLQNPDATPPCRWALWERL